MKAKVWKKGVELSVDFDEFEIIFDGVTHSLLSARAEAEPTKEIEDVYHELAKAKNRIVDDGHGPEVFT